MRRGPVYATNGMIAAAHPLAVAAGLEILAAGGNAMDAGIAASAVTSVVMPDACGLGGDLFFLYYEGSTGRIYAYNGCGSAGYDASVEAMRHRGYDRLMPLDGILSVAVPGEVDAYVTAARHLATMPLADLLAPAVRYAREGFPVDRHLARCLASQADRLKAYPATAEIFLPGGTPPGEGDLLVQHDLGGTLELVAREGNEGFYRGPVAREFYRCASREGGLFTGDEWAEHGNEMYRPLQVEYRGAQVYQTAPPSQGLIHLEVLALMEGYDLRSMGHNTTEAIHTMVELKKLAFADRLAYLGDPHFVPAPLDLLLEPGYIRRRRGDWDPGRAASAVPAWSLVDIEGDTTSLVAADSRGNLLSLIHSLSLSFGSALTIPGTGVLLNNRAGRGFNLTPGHPNCLAAGKRTMHTLNTYIVRVSDGTVIAGNTPGGDGQPQWNQQVVSNLLDFGLDVQASVDSPRWTSVPGTDPAGLETPVTLHLEDRIPGHVAAGLTRLGHRVKQVPVWSGGGCAQLIRRHPGGLLEGGSDSRGDGMAAGI